MATSRLVDQIGSVLGDRYRLLAPIGTGASAHVFLAEDASLRRRVAVKVLHEGLAADESFLRRFRAEAHAAAALRNAHVMNVYDWGEGDSGPYLVLEYLGGGSLRAMLDHGHRLTPSQALLVGLEAAEALAYAHRRNLVHRDVKPANLLFDDEGRLAIADFGLARALAEAAWTEPTGTVLGTARYASPEQAQGGAVDGRSDVYALALTIVESVTGEVPFSADTTIATLMARVGHDLEVSDDLGPLKAPLEAAGRADPNERLDAAGLVRAFEGAARDLPRPDPLPLPGTPAIDLTEAPAADLTELPVTKPTVFDADAAGAIAADDHLPGTVVAPRRGVRRWLRHVLTGVLVAVLLAGAAFAITEVRTPRFDVPALRGLTVEQAAQEVVEEQFSVVVARREFDENVLEGQILDQDPASGELKRGSTVTVVVSQGPRPRGVPDLAGMDQATAETALTEAGFEVAVNEEFSEDVAVGTVLRWDPTGVQAKGTAVNLFISAGPQPRKIPSFTDRAYDAVKGLLEKLGLVVQRQDAFSDDVAAGQVISTKPAEGQEAKKGETVAVNVSKGADLVKVPNLSGLSEDDAEKKLDDVGLKLGQRFGPKNRKVFDSNPSAGASVKRGSTVDIYTR
ncbi:MAG: PASTA domain-containing protein [Acidimicrobiales bacterium]